MASDLPPEPDDARTQEAAVPEDPSARASGSGSGRALATPAARGGAGAALPRGTAVGRYLILEEVGRGGMGRVYAAYDPQLDRRLALKLMIGAGDPVNKQRTLREARAMARLSHPHVVAVHDAGEVDGQVFVAMDLIEGTTLNKWLRQSNPAAPEILAAFRKAGEGLAAAHAAGLVHRDFKPANVLMGNKGQVAVTDFGLAREAVAGADAARAVSEAALARALPSTESQSLEPVTRAGVVSGTPQFMAPEQFAGAPVDARADQFAFCVALWQALYGEPPYPAKTVQELVNRMARGDLAQPADRRKVPRHIHRALERGLLPRADRRFPSMDALLREIAHDTGKGQRRLRLLAVLGATCAVAGGGWYRLSGAKQRACESSLQRMNAVWSGQARDNVRLAFTQALGDQGADAFTSVEQMVDVWIGTWKDAQAAVCRGSTGGLLDRNFQRQLGCFDELRLSAQALVGALSRLDRASAHAANDAVVSLASPETCVRADPRVAALDSPRAAVRSTIAEATMLNAMLNGKDAEQRGLDAVKQAQAAKLPDEEARAWLQVEVARGLLARFDDAEEAAVESIVAAERAGDFRELAYAWAERMYLLAMYRGEYHRAVEAGRHAQVFADRVGGDRFISARVAGLRAYILVQLGRWQEALEPVRQSIRSLEETFGKEHLSLVRPLLQLANVARQKESLTEAIVATERALAIQDKFLPATHPARAQALNARGRVLYAAGKTTEALEAHKKARELFAAAIPGAHPEMSKTLALIGEAQRALGNAPAARAAFKEALAQTVTFSPPTHPLRATLERDLGGLAAAAGNEAEAAESFERALLGTWQASDQAALHDGIAQARLNLGSWKEAAAAARSALAIAEQPARHFRLAQALWGLGEKEQAQAALEKAQVTDDPTLAAEIGRWTEANTKPQGKRGKKR